MVAAAKVLTVTGKIRGLRRDRNNGGLKGAQRPFSGSSAFIARFVDEQSTELERNSYCNELSSRHQPGIDIRKAIRKAPGAVDRSVKLTNFPNLYIQYKDYFPDTTPAMLQL